MTWETSTFKEHKKMGKIARVGECRFIDGMREVKRILWHDKENDKLYVIYNGEAEPFRPYSERCQVHEFIIGRI